MNYQDMKIELDNGKTISRESWTSKRTITRNPDDNTLLDLGKIGKVFDKNLDARNNFTVDSGEKIKKAPIDTTNTMPFELLESCDDNIDDWFVVC
jgi:hypothetical protein